MIPMNCFKAHIIQESERIDTVSMRLGSQQYGISFDVPRMERKNGHLGNMYITESIIARPL